MPSASAAAAVSVTGTRPEAGLGDATNADTTGPAFTTVSVVLLTVEKTPSESIARARKRCCPRPRPSVVALTRQPPSELVSEPTSESMSRSSCPLPFTSR